MLRTGYDSGMVTDLILSVSRDQGRPLTPMQLLKLTYIAHGWMLGLYGRPLVSENAEAWKYGPVLPSVYDRFKHFGAAFITDEPERPADIDSQAAGLTEQVWRGYSQYSGIQLSALTHKPGTPWDITWRNSGPGSVISNDLIEEHYRALARTRRSS